MKPLVLKEMAGALVSFAKGDGVARQEALHECGEAGRTAAKQEMEVIGDERPCDVQECLARKGCALSTSVAMKWGQ